MKELNGYNTVINTRPGQRGDWENTGTYDVARFMATQ